MAEVSGLMGNGRQDSNASDRKRKKSTIHRYKALFRPQRIRLKIVEYKNPEGKDKSPQENNEDEEESGKDGGGIKKHRKTVIRTIEPPVIEVGSNQGGSGLPVHNESQSSSGDPTALTNETSLHNLLKPTVSELCSILKFSEDVTIIVERFLEFVLESFRVGKEHTSILQPFMISLCWIGASLAQYNIDRSESLALATKLLNFNCLYEEVDSVYKKLEREKESFLQHTEILDSLKECIRTPHEAKLDTEKCQHTQNCLNGSHASEDGDETAPNDVEPDVDSQEMEIPDGNCDKENAEDRNISPDTLHAAEGNNEVSHNDVDSAEASTPADNYNEKNIGDNDTRPDTSSHAFEDHNDLCGSNNSNSLSSDVSLDKTPLVQPSATPPADHTMQTILDIENVSHQIQQPLDTGVQDKDGQVDLRSLAESTTAHHESSNEEGMDKNKRQMEDLSRKVQNEINKFKKDWDEKRVNLERDYIVEGALIRYLNSTNPSVRSEMLNILEKEYANKLDEHERSREIHLKDLEATLLAVNEELSLHVSQHETQVAPSLCENPIEAQSQDEPDHDTYVSIPNVMEDDDAENIESTHIHNPDKQMADATVSSEPVGEIPTQQNDDMEIDMTVADATVLSGPVAEVPAQQHDDMTGDVAVETDLTEMELPLVDSNQEHASLGGNCPDESHASEDDDETAPNDVVPDVDSQEMGMPGGNCDKENAEDRTISPDTLHDNDVGSHVDSAEASMPADNYNEENIGYNDTRPDTSSRAFEDHDDLCGSNNNNSLSADLSLDKTPLVQPSATLPSDHTMQTILEIENVSRQVQQPLVTGVQEKDGQVDLSSLAETTTGQPGEITLEDSPLDPHNELILPSSTDPLVPENQSNILPLSSRLVEHSTELTLAVSQSGGSLEEHLVAAETPLGEHESNFPSSDALPLPPPINPLDSFNNLNQVGARTPNHGDPLQAEEERLCTENHNLTQSYEVNKQRLNSDCDKEITEAIAQILLKYQVKHQEAAAAFHADKKELDTYLNRVRMNRILAKAFRSKCQDLTPPVRLGSQQVCQPGLMQQLHWVSGPSSVRRSPGTAPTSPGQATGSQQTPPSPPRSLPLQIVHHPAALFSSTPSRPQHCTNLQSPSTTSIRPPPNTNSPINSMSTRPSSDMDPTSPSTAPTRPPPIVNTITPSTTPTTSRLPPVINTITPSTTPSTSRLPHGINPISPSSTPSTSRPPHVSRTITASSTSNRPSPGVNTINSSSTQNRSPYMTNTAHISAVHLRINTETRGQTAHVRPVSNGEARTPPSRMQSVPSSEILFRAPHVRSAVSSESRDPAPHTRSMASGGIRAPAPHIRPFRSQSPLPTSSQQLLPPLPPEASFVPQLPPPSNLPSTSSPLSHSSSHVPLQRIPLGGGPSLASVGNSNVVMDNGARFPTPPDLSQFNFMDLTNVFQEGGTRSSANEVVCLSDDE